MYLNQWNILSGREQAQVIASKVQDNREVMQWVDGFEPYSLQAETLLLINRFIALTETYHKTHAHYGAKAIIECLRWDSHSRDGCRVFKINNNYTTDITRLVKLIFSEQLDAFFLTRVRRMAA